ncbi:MAG: class I SAM-dependent methyltransferase [Pseudomonadota bacterium]
MCLAHTAIANTTNGATAAAIDEMADGDLPPFAADLLDTLNKAGTAIMLSIGHRTGLFDTMRAGDARSSAGWATAAGLDERYVREWLGAMVSAGIVEVDPMLATYRLPPEHAAFLGQNAPDGSMTSMMQWIGVLAPVESKIVDCFRKGGGLSYGAFHRFHDVMAEEGALTLDVDATVALVPGLAARLEAGIDVLDVGCGRGRALRELAARYPNSRFTGYDLWAEAVAHARQLAVGLNNVRFMTVDCMNMDDEDTFDLIFTFDAVHDQPHPDRLLANIRRALRPDGVYIMQDIWAHSEHADNVDHPLGPFLYTISCMHCMTVSLGQGGVGLGAVWGEELARKLIAEAGFDDTRMHRLPHDIQNAYYVCRAS